MVHAKQEQVEDERERALGEELGAEEEVLQSSGGHLRAVNQT